MRSRSPILVLLACLACAEAEEPRVAPYSSLDQPARARERTEPVSVRGHVLDGATREPVAGARVEGPGGRSSVSRGDGFFELRGFELGEEGEVTARTDDGRVAETRLLPLRDGGLEVVLHVTAP